MPRANPTGTGLLTAFRRPSLVAGEVAWRWSFGAASLALAVVAFAGFLDALVVTDRDLLALGSGNDNLMAWALTHIFEDAGPRLLRALAVLIPAVTLLWIVAASLGRAATLAPLVEGEAKLRLRSMFTLHALRAALAIAAMLAIFGIMIVAALLSTKPDGEGFARTQPGLYWLLLVLALPPLVLAWRFLSWLLSVAAIFVVHSGLNAAQGIARAARAWRHDKGRFLGVAALLGVLQLVATGTLFMTLLSVLGAFAGAGLRATLAALALFTMAYFMAMDFLRIARLAAYVEICFPKPVSTLVPESSPALPGSPSVIPAL